MAEYGKMGSQKELRESGYILPDSHFITPSPDGSGEASADEKAQLDAMKSEKEESGAPEIDNKAVLPTRATKKAARTRK